MDDITGILLNHCRSHLLKPIQHLINSSITSSIDPKNLKTSLVYQHRHKIIILGETFTAGHREFLVDFIHRFLWKLQTRPSKVPS